MASKILSFLPIFLVVAAYADAAGITESSAGSEIITGPREIAKVLEQLPKFSTFRDLLIQTKLDKEIDSRQSVTLLVVANSAISSLAKLPADVQQKVLSVHVVLDYYDLDKITNLPNTTALLTTLFQASGKSAGQAGFLNASDVGDGVVKIGSAVPKADLTAEIITQVAKQPYNLSLIEISEVIMPPGIESGSKSNGSGNSTTPSASAPKAATPSPKASPSPSESDETSSSPSETPVASSPESSETLAPESGSEAPKASSAGRLVSGLGIGVTMLVACIGAL